MNLKNKVLLFLLLSLALIPNSSYSLTNSAVAEPLRWAQVIQIKSEAPDASGDTAPGYCNATLIHRNLLITAAHCIKLAVVSGQKKIDMEVGFYKYITRKTDGKVVRVGYLVRNYLSKIMHIEVPRSLADKLARSGGKATISPGEDFAMLWWNEETPELADIELAEVVTPAEHNSITSNISQYIFSPVTINPFSEMSLDTKRMSTLNMVKWKGYVYSKSTSRVEEGDSGAPLFTTINNKLKVMAVVKGRASTLFDNWDAYSPVTPHLCQIAATLPTFIKLDACK